MNERCKICLADNDLSALEELTEVVCNAGFSVSAYQSAQELLQELDHEDASCVVFDANLPDSNVPTMLQAIASRTHYLPVVFVGSKPPVSAVVQAMKAGAIDFLEKPFTPHEITAALKVAATRHQEVCIHSEDLQRRKKQFKLLTLREQQIFKFVVTGMLNKQIAAELGIAEKTVKVHRGRVMKKLEVRSVAELVRLFERLTAGNGPVQCSPPSTMTPSF